MSYSKTPWYAAPWHTNFANTLFGFRSKNSQDTLFFGQFINPKLHYSIFANIVIIIFTEMSGEIILISAMIWIEFDMDIFTYLGR